MKHTSTSLSDKEAKTAKSKRLASSSASKSNNHLFTSGPHFLIFHQHHPTPWVADLPS